MNCFQTVVFKIKVRDQFLGYRELRLRPVAQLARALVSKTRGWAFDSPQAWMKAIMHKKTGWSND